MYQFSVVKGKCCRDPAVHWVYFIPCAGCGPCNIFCCNCENGCNRKWHSYNGIPKMSLLNRKWYPSEKVQKKFGLTCGHWDKKRELVQNSKNASFEADKLFRDIDTDDSRDISINETKQFLANKMKLKRSALLSFSFTHTSFEEEFAKMDENNDGKISPFEFDESLEN